MKDTLRALFSPILSRFEAGEEPYNYQPSHRTILKAVGALFLLLSLVCLHGARVTAQPGAWLPFVIFFAAALVCGVVGLLGNDRAVAKIWGNR